MSGLKAKIRNLPDYLASLKPISIEAADHDYFDVFLKSKEDLDRLLPIPLNKASILIIGCGYRYPDVMLYSRFANIVYGLDVEKSFYRDGFNLLYFNNRLKGKGVIAALYNTYIKRNGLKQYYKHISNLAHIDVNHNDLQLVSYSSGKITFEDDTFDVVMSNAVIEHVLDPDSFFAEIARVTKSSGLSYHLYHNYYSFSGSHLPMSLCEKHPWGHLRGHYTTDPKHLNKIRIETVLKLFSSSFDLINVFQVGKDHSKKGVDHTFRYEREDLLTAEIRNELSYITVDELLTRSYLIVGRKT